MARAAELSLELGTPIAPGFEALVFKASRGIEDIYALTYTRKDGSRTGVIIPGHGLVAPKYFIPALEETGLIIQVGNWAIGHVCDQIRQWTTSPIGPRQVSVNVSGRQFVEHDLDADVNRALRESGINAALLELELTESSLMQNTEATIAALVALKGRGVELSIDDFGTGYSSLSYLQRFPIDKVKIDIAFVRNIVGDTGDSTIAHTIIQMAHSLKMKAIAEGVETAEQLAYLRHHGCDEIQGYYCSRPLPVSDVEAFMRKSGTAVAPMGVGEGLGVGTSP